MIPLPPKRFQNPADPVYDPIRHKPWFGKLLKRRAKLPLLEQALLAWMVGGSQKQAAEEFGLDERELRDYRNWIERAQLVPICASKKTFQHILEAAHATYQNTGGSRHLRTYIEVHASRWGLTPRHVTELWEVDPTFFPLGYNLTKPKEGK
jgi:hypothetical protein